MFDVLPIPLPWYLIGPLMGITVSGLYALTNKHLGISGAYVEALQLVQGRTRVGWRLWFLGGTFIGAVLVAILGGSPQAGLEYGALGDYLSLPALIAVLIAGGVLIGFGARAAGGCTSGHGITGCATRSPGSFVAVSIFVGTAVAVTLIIHALTGGDL
jgi:uncharacterized membrane protein YedE/YeeE